MPASGPYESRSLSFLTRQSRKLADRLGITMRRIKTATVWGAQALLYPVYLLFQTGRLIGKQLQQEWRKPWPLFGEPQPPPPEPPAADQAIREVLEGIPALFGVVDAPPQSLPAAAAVAPQLGWSVALDCLESAGGQILLVPSHLQTSGDAAESAGGAMVMAPTLELASREGVSGCLEESSARSAAMTATAPLAIQGVASLVTTRRLVLITAQNQVLDILSASQQRQLYDRIVWAVADYYYRLRSLRLQQQPFTLSLPLPVERPQVLWPFRAFRRLMGWVQQGPVATTLDLFRESMAFLADSPSEPRPMRRLPPARFPQIAPMRQKLRQGLRALPSLPVAQSSPPAPPTLAEPQAPTPETSWKSFEPRPYLPAVISLPPPGPLTVVHGNRQVLEPPPVASPTVSGVDDASESEDWLTWSDLFDRPKVAKPGSFTDLVFSLVPPRKSKKSEIQPASRAAKPAPVASQPEAGVSSQTPQQFPQDLTPVSPPELVDRAVGAGNLMADPATQADMSTTWIEIEAESIGYIKHPLEHVIGWLDRCFLWVERLIAAIFHRVQTFLKRPED